MAGRATGLTNDREGAAIAVNALRQDLTARPAEFCWAAIWLLLLTMTGFNAIVVGIGLLAALTISGSTPSRPHPPSRTPAE